jgi:hypothetical protein
LGSWLNLGVTGRPQTPPADIPPAGAYTPNEPPPYNAPYTSSYTGSWTTAAGPEPGAGPIPPQPPPYAEPYPGAAPGAYAENYPPGAIPPIPPVPPYSWRRREPVFAFVLIGLGIIFLLQSLGFVTHLMHYIWPFMLIGLGIWLVVRRVGYTQGGPK